MNMPQINGRFLVYLSLFLYQVSKYPSIEFFIVSIPKNISNKMCVVTIEGHDDTVVDR